MEALGTVSIDFLRGLMHGPKGPVRVIRRYFWQLVAFGDLHSRRRRRRRLAGAIVRSSAVSSGAVGCYGLSGFVLSTL